MNNQSKFKVIEDVVPIGGIDPSMRLQATLGKISLFQISSIKQLSIVMDDRSELVISMANVQGSTANNLFVVSGKPAYVAAPSQREPELGRPPSPPPSPAFNNKKSATKPKIRLRNKCVREMLLAGAGDFGEDNDLISAGDLLFKSRFFWWTEWGGDRDDSDKTTVPSLPIPWQGCPRERRAASLGPEVK